MVDPAYITVQVPANSTDLKARAWSTFTDYFPEADVPADGSFADWLVNTDAETAADVATLLQENADDIATRVMGAVLQEPQRLPVAATSTISVPVSGANAVTISAGEYFEGIGPNGDPVTVVTLTPGSAAQAQTIISGIPVQVVEDGEIAAGAASNGTTGVLQGAESFPFTTGPAVLDAPLAGGSDGEGVDAYRARLAGLATLYAPQPILAPEFARYVTLKVEGVGRAIALDETKPAAAITPGNPVPVGGTVNTGVQRAVTVGIVGTDGTNPGPSVATAARDALVANTVTSQDVTVVTANYTTVNVAATVYIWPGYDADLVKVGCAEILAAYLSPDRWGAPPTQGDSGTVASTELLPAWEQQTKVRVSEVVEQLGRVRGVDYTNPATVTINGTGADLALPGLLPLPLAGTFTITVLPR